jgi:hypothetical protein
VAVHGYKHKYCRSLLARFNVPSLSRDSHSEEEHVTGSMGMHKVVRKMIARSREDVQLFTK